MKLYDAMLKTVTETGWMAVEFNKVVYHLNPYGGSVEDGDFDLRSGLGSFGEMCLDPKYINSTEFKPAELPNRADWLDNEN